MQFSDLGAAENVLTPHTPHTLDPAAANRPALHTPHTAEDVPPLATLTVPAPHGMHSEEPFPEYVPGPHCSHTNVSVISTFLNPARHWHPSSIEPRADVLFPGHFSHITAPLTENSPTPHCTHTAAPSRLNVPASHSAHADSSVTFVAPENFPATQLWHVPGLPSLGAPSNVPAPHARHALALGPA